MPLPVRNMGRMLDVFAQRKVLEAAAGAGAQPGKAVEAAVTVHGGQRVLKPLAMGVSCAVGEVEVEEGDSELRGPGAVLAPRGVERPRRRCG